VLVIGSDGDEERQLMTIDVEPADVVLMLIDDDW